MANEFVKSQALIDEMKSGKEVAILSGLRHKGALLRINAIINVVRHKFSSDEVITAVKSLFSDATVVDGYAVSDFAKASLDISGFEKYEGENEKIKALISSEFLFYS